MTREDYVRTESEKWLAERRHPNPPHLKRRKTRKKWALWIPTVIVVLICVFIDQTLPFASHMLHPRSGRLAGYQVSIPLTWTVTYSTYRHQGDERSTLVAERYRGLLPAASDLYVGRRPSFSISTMNFGSTPAGDPFASKPYASIISARTAPFGEHSITCWEESPAAWMIAERYIQCSTSTGDFAGTFSGNNQDVSEFYRILESTKRRME